MLILALGAAILFLLFFTIREAYQLRHVKQFVSYAASQLLKSREALSSRIRLASPALKSTSNLTHPRLSFSPSELRPSYDVVIIGSGYGSGVAASRFARAGKSICVLERGAERWPGEYPHTAKEAMKNYEVCGQKLGRSRNVGRTAGLYRTVKGKGQDIFMGCGLGGTSLINAGVWLRADERLLAGKDWPMGIREEGLDEYYVRGERMFRPTPYPATQFTPKKLGVFEEQARDLGVHDAFHRPPLTTTFDDGLNQAGVRMHANTGSGNECSGLNDGSKNSVLATYLADAWAWGAELFCGIDVKSLKKRENGAGYIIFLDIDDAPGSGRSSWVIAKELVILGAGAIGTPTILLRSRLHGLSSSPLLGQRLSGNGDMLAFSYNTNQKLDAIGRETGSHCGPTITGCIDLRGPAHTIKNGRDGYVIQDGAIPEALAPVIQPLLELHRVGPASPSYSWLRGTIARWRSLGLGPYYEKGSVNRTMVFLIMSHDENQGSMELVGDGIDVKWEGPSTAGNRTSRIEDMIKKMTDNLGGMYVKAPEITVHPLGGAVMSSDGTGLGGVVSHRGEVLIGDSDKVHEGLFCVDGSIVPTSLGVNPCATITALAERTCDLIMRERGWEADERPNGELDLLGDPPSSSSRCKTRKLVTYAGSDCVRFDETMRGHIHLASDISDFGTAESIAMTGSSTAELRLSVTAHRTRSGSYLGLPHGTFACGALSPDPLLITDGSVEFFTDDNSVSDARGLVYSLGLLTTSEKRHRLHGYKRIDPSVTLSVGRAWRATTTLYTIITAPDGSIVGRGILHLPVKELMTTLRLLFTRSDALTLLYFLMFFARNIAAYFFAPFRPLQHPPSYADDTDYFDKPEPEKLKVHAEDGLNIPLKIWYPPAGTPKKTTPLILFPGAAVDDQIFSLPTIPINTVDYFTSLGYTCYTPTLRFGAGENARWGYTAYDARLDVRAVVNYVYENERTKVYIIAHCLGSIATAMALLTGSIDSSQIAGLTVSQVFMHIEYSPDNAFKARHPVLLKLYETLSATPWFPIANPPRIPFIDQFLRFYPVGTRKEICASASCHRSFVPFGRCWNHANLNHSTHSHLHAFFDGVHASFIKHLSGMGAQSPATVRSNFPDFEDLVTPRNLERLRGLKVLFLYGEDNAVWSAGATKRSFDVLREIIPEGEYERCVVRGYGHLDSWMGKDAVRDVWPGVGRHVGMCEEDEGGMEGWEDVGHDEGLLI